MLKCYENKITIHRCSKYNIADGMRQMFDPFERVARAHHICPCCERPFSAEEEDEFVKKVHPLIFYVLSSNLMSDSAIFTELVFDLFTIAKSESCKLRRAHEIVGCGIFRY